MAEPAPIHLDATTWLHELYGTAETGWVTLFTVDRATGRPATDWAPVTDLNALAAQAAEREPHSCVWFGVATRRQRLEGGRRGGHDDCAALPGLWVDIDIAGPGHRSAGRLARDRAHAHQLVDAFPLAPSAVIDTGGGLQAWWLFDELHEVDDDTDRLLAAWGATWNRLAERQGIDLDNVFDTARIMRLPGTTNRKEDLARPVVATRTAFGCRYGTDGLEQHLDDPPAPPQHRTGSQLPYIGPERPGDAYSLRHTGGDLLGRHGFTLARTDRNGDEHWVRPGKDAREGTSATVYAEDGHTTIWSSTVAANWPAIEVNRPYDPFGLYVALEHAGDFATATKTLRNAGYGAPPETPDADTVIGDTLTKPTGPAGRARAAAIDEPAPPWPEPKGLPAADPLPTWPTGVLPAWMDDQIANVAASVQCSVDLPAMFGLGAIAVAALGHVDVEARPGRREPTALYLAAIAGVSEGKSPAHEIMLGPVTEHEDMLIEAANSDAAMDETERQALEDQIKTLDARINRGDETDIPAAKLAAAQARAELKNRPAPASGRRITGDATPERLATLMATTNEAMSIVSDEAGVLNIDRYGDKRRGSNIDLYLNGWNGGRVIVDRQNGQSVRLKRPLINFVVGAQPEAWDRIMADQELRDRGIGARFMACRPPIMADTRDDDLDRDVWDHHVDDTYRARMGELCRRLGAWGNPATVRLSPEARLAWTAWARGVTARTRPGGDLDHEIGWVSKLKSSTLRVAALLHLADDGAHDAPVTADTIARAVRLGDYWVAHRLYDATVQAKGARRLLGALIRLQEAVVAQNPRATRPFVARRELGRKGPRDLRTIDEYTAPLTMLIDGGLVRLVAVTGGENQQVSQAIRNAAGIEVHPDAARWVVCATPRDTARQPPQADHETTRGDETVPPVAHVALRATPETPSVPLHRHTVENPGDTRDKPTQTEPRANPHTEDRGDAPAWSLLAPATPPAPPRTHQGDPHA